MDDLSEQIRFEIKKQFGTLKKFSEVSGIPYSTLVSAMKKGVGGTAYRTVVRICGLLRIRQPYGCGDRLYREFSSRVSALDEEGLGMVNAVLDKEYARCASKGPRGSGKANSAAPESKKR